MRTLTRTAKIKNFDTETTVERFNLRTAASLISEMVEMANEDAVYMTNATVTVNGNMATIKGDEGTITYIVR